MSQLSRLQINCFLTKDKKHMHNRNVVFFNMIQLYRVCGKNEKNSFIIICTQLHTIQNTGLFLLRHYRTCTQCCMQKTILYISANRWKYVTSVVWLSFTAKQTHPVFTQKIWLIILLLHRSHNIQPLWPY